MIENNGFVFYATPYLGTRVDWVAHCFLQSLVLDGDIAELGVAQGHTSKLLATYLKHIGDERTLHMFDTFQGIPDVLTKEEKKLSHPDKPQVGNYNYSPEEVGKFMSGVDNYVLYPGLFSETLLDFDRNLVFVHVDADLYQSTKEAIKFLDLHLLPGGFAVFDDYGVDYNVGVKSAIDKHLDYRTYMGHSPGGSTQFVVERR